MSDAAIAAPPGFVLIQPGTFMMGSPPEEAGRYDDETQHEVTLTRPFYMQATPVTQAQYRALMGNNPSYFKGDDLPVETVSWYEAIAYANALSAREGLTPYYAVDGVAVMVLGGGGYRLPTEAKWEYACRAGTTGARYGDPDEIAWYHDNSGSQTHPVAQKQPNAWGLYDMLGNVWEWVWDCYGPYPSGAATDPVGPRTGSRRVLRGGSWSFYSQGARAAIRNDSTPDYRGDFLGFRLARSAPGPSDPSSPDPLVARLRDVADAVEQLQEELRVAKLDVIAIIENRDRAVKAAMVGHDAAHAALSRVLALAEDAPHGVMCEYEATRGLGVPPAPCDCWHADIRAALSPAPREET